jgi:uncharacterized protein (TIGR03663 family)
MDNVRCKCAGGAWTIAGVLVIAAALAVRLPALDRRPMHGDEANQAVRTGLLLDQGVYHYDPTDHHGPVLYFAAYPFCRATAKTFAETTEWNFRLVPVVFSCLTLVLFAALGPRRDGTEGLFHERTGLMTAALLTALSPAMVYYARFFIQESLLITFLTGMLVCAVRYTARPNAWAAAGFGVCAGLAAATKETVVLSFAAAGVAAVAACGVGRLARAWRMRDAAIAVVAAAVVAGLFFSSFFTYPKGVFDALFATASAYFNRATAVPEHQHPWSFYLNLLFWFRYGRGPVWTEAGLLPLAALACLAAFWPRRTAGAVSARARWVRFLAVYTLVLTALYSAIPYKTPWCVLSILQGLILLAGLGVEAVVGWTRGRRVGVCAGVFAALALFVSAVVGRDVFQTLRACYRYPADSRNPYVYAHTGTDALNLVAAIEASARKAQGRDTLIAVAAPTPDTWPLPWYLRSFARVGYWTRVEDIPASLSPEIVIAAADQGDVADARFGKGKRASFFGIRPGVLLNLFVPIDKKNTP